MKSVSPQLLPDSPQVRNLLLARVDICSCLVLILARTYRGLLLEMCFLILQPQRLPGLKFWLTNTVLEKEDSGSPYAINEYKNML